MAQNKYVKTEEQIRGIRKSCLALVLVFKKLEQLIKPGVTTTELEKEALKMMAKSGGRPAFKGYKTHSTAKAFPSALCISINEEIVHGPATPSRTIKEGDVVSIDAGLELDGYYSDMARTFGVGKISPKAEKLIKVTQEALAKGTAQMRPGNTLDDVGTVIQKWVEGNGFGVVRELVGHGVGLAVHEDPQIPHYAIRQSGLPNVSLKAGMVLALEPMVTEGDWRIDVAADGFTFLTRDRRLAAHFENTVLITADGPEVLTDY